MDFLHILFDIKWFADLMSDVNNHSTPLLKFGFISNQFQNRPNTSNMSASNEELLLLSICNHKVSF